MSNVVDERVMSMKFDNKDFEKNVSTSMTTLDKLKNALNMKDDGKKADLSPLVKSVDKFKSILNTAQLYNNFQNLYGMINKVESAIVGVIRSATNMGKALTIDPIKTGFSEYETKINAIQTIMSNTESKGKTMDDVTAVLDKLNTYADKTIYNFTEMTRNIGTFTAAGVDLDKSAEAIQGIANLAAASGSNSHQASTAMYQLSQALAAGTVKLMDWNSVVNAGMGGQKFQDALKATAREYGVAVDDIIKKNGSFRESLQEGWITADILNETLSKFTVEGAEKYAQSMLKSGKYTQAQADALIKEAHSMEDAATKVKTFTQLWDTLKESAQSGWTQSWEIIVGNFTEARETLTKVSDTIGGMLNASANARNELLQGWKNLGGRNDVIESFKNLFDSVMNVVKPIHQAFKEFFPPKTAEQLKSITEHIKQFTSSLILSQDGMNNLRDTARGVFSILKVGVTIVKSIFKAFTGFGAGLAPIGGRILEITGALGRYISDALKTVNVTDSINDIFSKLANIVKTVIGTVTSYLNNFWSVLSDTFNSTKGAVTSFSSGIEKAVSKVKEFISAVVNGFSGNGIMGIINGGLFAGLLVGLRQLVKGLQTTPELVGTFLNGISENIKGKFGIVDVLNQVKNSLVEYQSKLKAKTLINIAMAVGILAASLKVLSTIDSEGMVTALSGMTGGLVVLVGAMKYISKLKGFKFKGSTSLITMVSSLLILSFALKKLSSIGWKQMTVALVAMGTSLTALTTAMVTLQVFSGKKNRLTGVKQLIAMASSLLILSFALQKLSNISWKQMAVALVAMGTTLGTMTASLVTLQKVSNKNRLTGVKQLIAMSSSLLILSFALTKLANIQWKQLAVALTAMGVSLGAMVAALAAINKIPVDIGEKFRGGSSLITMAASMILVAEALEKLAVIQWERLGIAVTAMGIALAEMVTALLAINKIPRGFGENFRGGSSLIVVATSLLIVGKAIEKLAEIPWTNLGAAMGAMGAALAGMVLAINKISVSKGVSSSLIVFSSAVLILSGAIKVLAGLSLGGIIKSLGALAGALFIMAAAAAAFEPFTKAMLKVAGAITLLGTGCLAAGVGIAALAAGLGALGVAFATDAKNITNAIISLLEFIPLFIEKCVEGLVKAIPDIVNGIGQLIVAVSDSLTKYVPLMVESFAKFCILTMDGLAKYTPALVDSLCNLFSVVFHSFADKLTNGSEILGKSVVALGIMAVLMHALAGVGALAGPALIGVAAIGAVIAEFVAVLAALGGIAQIPKLDWILNEGSSLLDRLGEILGSFMGKLVGNFVGNVSTSFAKIGSNLSKFMENLQGFLDGARSIDKGVVTGIKNLSEAMLLISGTSFVENFVSGLRFGQNSYAEFFNNATLMAQAINAFGEELGDISPEMASKIKMASEAGKALAEFAKEIPNTGGAIAWFTGDNNDITGFADGIKSFLQVFIDLAPMLDKVDTDKLNLKLCRLADAGIALADFAKAIPNTGGAIAWFTGDNNDISAFTEGIKCFVNALIELAPKLEEVDTNKLQLKFSRLANAGKAMVEFNESIPDAGFMSLTSFILFLAQMEDYINVLIELSPKLEAIDAQKIYLKIQRLANAGQAMAYFNQAIPPEGFKSLAGFVIFVGEMMGYADALIALAPKLEAINAQKVYLKIQRLANAGQSMAFFSQSVPDTFKSLAGFHEFIEELKGYVNDLITLAPSLDKIDAQKIYLKIHRLANAGQSMAFFDQTIPIDGAKQLSSFVLELKKYVGYILDIAPSLDQIDTLNIYTKLHRLANAGQSLAFFAETIPTVDKAGDFSKFTIDIGSYISMISEVNKLLCGDGSKDSKEIDTSLLLKKINNVSKIGTSLASLQKTAGASGEGGDLSTLSKGLGELGKCLWDFASSTESVDVSAVANEINTIAPAISKFKFGEGFRPAFLEVVGDGLKTLGKGIKDFAKNTKGVDIDSTALDNIKTAFADINTFLAAATSPDVDISSSSAQVKAMAEAINSLDFTNVDSDELNAVGKAIGNLGVSIVNFSTSTAGIDQDTLAKPIQAIESAFSLSLQNIKSTSQEFATVGTNFATQIANGLTTNTKPFTDGGVKAAAAFLNGINSVNALAEAAGSYLATSAVNGAKSQYASFEQIGKNIASGMASGIRAGASEAVNAAIALAKSSRDAAANALAVSSPSRVFMEIGNYAAQGFAIGIQNGTPGASSAALAMAKSTEKTVTDALGIHSPSYAFEAFGRYVGEGFANGIKQKVDDTVKTTKGMAERVKSVAKKSLEDIDSYISNREAFDDITPVEELSIYEAHLAKLKKGSDEWYETAKKAYALWKEVGQSFKESDEEWGQEQLDNAQRYIDNQKKYNSEWTDQDTYEAWERVLNRMYDNMEKFSEDVKQSIISAYDEAAVAVHDTYSHSMSWLDDKLFFGEINDEEYLEGLYRIRDRYEAGDPNTRLTAEERDQLYRDIKTKEDEVKQQRLDAIEETYQAEVEAIDDAVYYGEMGLEAQLDAQKRLLEEFGDDAERRKKIEREIFDLENEIADTRKEYEEEVYNVEQDAAQQRLELEQNYQEEKQRILDEANEKRKELEDDYYQKCQDVQDQLESDIQSLNDEYEQAYQSRADALYSAYGLFDKVEEKENVKGSDLTKNLQDQIKEFETWTNTMASLEAKGVNADLLAELREMGVGSIKEVEALNNMTEPELTDYVQLWNEKHRLVTEQTTKELASMRANTDAQIGALKENAETQLEDLRLNWQDQLAQLDADTANQLSDLESTFAENMSTLNAETAQKLEELKTDFETKMGTISKDTDKTVKDMSKNVTTTVDTMAKTTEKSVDNMTKEVGDSVKDMSNDTIATVEDTARTVEEVIEGRDWESVGTGIVQGMERGIENEAPIFLQKLVDLAQQALDSMNSALDINSPSKKFIKVGQSIDEGLVVGVDTYAQKVAEAGESLGQDSVDIFTNTISAIRDTIDGDIDMNPTIRPVLDLSDISLGANTINSLINQDRVMSMKLRLGEAADRGNGIILADLSSKWDKAAESNSKIVNAIDRLREDNATLADAMRNMQVVMDTGTLVGAISPEMDRSLGKISRFKGRGM